jgi:hypothetical protein
MAGEVEANGDIVTGAAIVRAFEPPASSKISAHNAICLNCGTELVGPHCHRCGQPAHVHRTLASFGHDFLHSILHFDGKFIRTLPLLAWRPGDLTRRYIHGERAKFVSPLAMFLFSVFLLFASFNLGGGSSDFLSGVNKGIKNPKALQNKTKIETELAKATVALDQLDRKKLARSAAAPPDARLDKQISDAKAQIKAIKFARDAAAAGFPVELDGLGKAGAWKGADTGNAKFDKAIDHAMENPDLMLYKIKSNGYKYSWALIPLSVPFVWLLFFWRREYKLFDHAVFVTYSLCFMSILFALWSLPIPWIGDVIVILTMFYIPFHMYRQMRGAYALGRKGALLRVPLLLFFALIVMVLEIVMLFLMGLE